MSTTAKKIANNTIFQVIGKIFSMSVTILATIIITRIYGRTEFGEFNLMQGIPALFFIIADFGLNAIATREIAQDISKAHKYLGNILVIRILMSLILILIGIVAISFFPYSPGLKFGIYLGMFVVLTQALYATTNIIFQVKLRYDLSTIGYICGSVVILTLVLIFSFLKLEVVWVNFSYVIGGIVTFVVNVFLLRRLGIYIFREINFSKGWHLGMDYPLWKYLFAQTLPLGLMFVFSQINFRADSILISVLELPKRYGLNNTESVAIYGLPYKVFEVSLVVPTFFMNSVYPVLVRHMVEGKERLKQTFLRVTAILSGSGLALGALGVIFAPLAIRILGGTEFEQSITVLRILIAGIVIFYTSQPLAWLIVTLGRQKYLPGIYLVGAIFNVAANHTFIPKYSFYASSVITLASEFIILSLLAFFAVRAWKQKYA